MAYAKSLNKKEVEEILPLTPLQEGMLFHYLNEPESEMYFEQLSITLDGSVDPDIFKKAWNNVGQNNEALRSVIRWDKLEKPLQIVLKTPVIPVDFYDYSYSGIDEKLSLAQEMKLSDRRRGIDISVEPLRITLIKLDNSRFEMVISNHHIIFDGWSNGILLKEFFNSYNSLFNGKEPEKVYKNRFSEYIKWIKAQNKDEQELYWKENLAGLDVKSLEEVLGKRKTNDFKREYTRGKYSIGIDDRLYDAIKKFSKENNTTLATMFYSAWGILLGRFTASEDVTFGTTVSGRDIPIRGIENMTGLFINTLPVRMKFDAESCFIDTCTKLDEMLAGRRNFESSSLADIKVWCSKKSADPLFDTLVVVENYPLS